MEWLFDFRKSHCDSHLKTGYQNKVNYLNGIVPQSKHQKKKNGKKSNPSVVAVMLSAMLQAWPGQSWLWGSLCPKGEKSTADDESILALKPMGRVIQSSNLKVPVAPQNWWLVSEKERFLK